LARVQAARLLISLRPLHATTGVGVIITHYPGLTLFLVFPSAAIGRLPTDIAIGLGPSFIHDLKPKGGGMTAGN